MSSVLYYSKYCENCKKLLYELGKTKIQKDIHFLSIDKRINREGKPATKQQRDDLANLHKQLVALRKQQK